MIRKVLGWLQRQTLCRIGVHYTYTRREDGAPKPDLAGMDGLAATEAFFDWAGLRCRLCSWTAWGRL